MTNPTLIILGKPGCGKSHLGNIITDETIFPEHNGLSSKTREIEEATRYIKGIGQTVTLIDTTGFETEKRSSFSNLVNEATYMEKIFARPFNMILYCISATETRFDNVHIQNLLLLEALFGKEIGSHICFVITQWDCLGPSIKPDRKTLWGVDSVIRMLSQPRLSFISKHIVLHADKDNMSSTFLRPFSSIMGQLQGTLGPFSIDRTPRSLLERLREPIVQKYLLYVIKAYEDDLVTEKAKIKNSNENAYQARIDVLSLISTYLNDSISVFDMLQRLKEKSSLSFFQAFANYFECETTSFGEILSNDIGVVFSKPLDKLSKEEETKKEYLLQELNLRDRSEALVSRMIDSMAEMSKKEFPETTKEELIENTRSTLDFRNSSSSLQSSFEAIQNTHNQEKNKGGNRENSNFIKTAVLFFSTFSSYNFNITNPDWITVILGVSTFAMFSFESRKRYIQEKQKESEREKLIRQKLINCVYGCKACKDIVMASLITYFDNNKI